MSIDYLCVKCSNVLNMKGPWAINEVGRKFCYGCGHNDDDLIVVDAEEVKNKVDEYNDKVNRT